jgi:His-Xaa-Ser system radical SAM maturase HxsB
MTKVQSPQAFQPMNGRWQMLPLRFERFDANRVLMTNMVGEHLFVSSREFDELTQMRLPADSPLVRRLRAKHLIMQEDERLPLELLALKVRTRYARLPCFTGLHIFVVSLRCEHSCPYCQVSRQSSDKVRFDMSETIADRALEMTFRSPSPHIKIEFQGGEPLLNFPLVERVVLAAEERNRSEGRDLAFVIATNLALLDDHIVEFCRDHDVYISTSLDGPADLHNRNRPRPGGDSWERAVAGIRRVRETLGFDHVSALMTTTRASLERARDIVDCYLEQGFNQIFLRPLSPYGFALRTQSHTGYETDRWLAFYEEGLDYILDLNRSGVDVTETYASIILKKILTNEDPGYVDLTSPSGIGIGAIVYNYDGDVYASDEGRMLAEMGDTTFRLGNLQSNTYEEILLSDALLEPLEASFSASVPMCSDCAFEPYCGSDPVFHHATAGDYVGRKPQSAFHRRNHHIFKLLLDRYESDPKARQTFLAWAGR